MASPPRLIEKVPANGGQDFGKAVDCGAKTAEGIAGMLNQIAVLISTNAQYERRREEWGLQRDLADFDIKQIEYQITAQEIRKKIAEQELKIHNKSIEQAKEIEDFLKGKFTNK